MPQIRLDQLTEDMVAASDIKNMDGMLLVPTGSALTPRQIGILRSWGISHVDVLGAQAGEVPDDPLLRLSPEEVGRMTAELKSCFWNFDDANPVQHRVFQYVLRRQARLRLAR